MSDLYTPLVLLGNGDDVRRCRDAHTDHRGKSESLAIQLESGSIDPEGIITRTTYRLAPPAYSAHPTRFQRFPHSRPFIPVRFSHSPGTASRTFLTRFCSRRGTSLHPPAPLFCWAAAQRGECRSPHSLVRWRLGERKKNGCGARPKVAT